jgi:hypothetical protein
MSNPDKITTLQDTWTKIASGVSYGKLWVVDFGTPYYYTYRIAGETPPTAKSDGVLLQVPSLTIAYEDASDLYIWSDTKDGEVRFDYDNFPSTPRNKRPLDLFMSTLTGQPAKTTLSAPALKDTNEVTLTSVTGITTGQYFGMFDTATEQFEFATVVAPPVENVVTIDSPLCCDFSAGSLFNPLTRDLNVDGSGTPITFSIAPQASGRVRVTRILGVMTTTGTADFSKFGDIDGGLLKGIVLRRNNGITDNIWNVKSNADFASLAYDFDIFDPSGPLGVNGLKFRYTFNGEDKHGTSVLLPPGDRLDLIVQDNLSTILSFRITVQGYEE